MPDSGIKKWTDVYEKGNVTREAFETVFPDLTNVMKICSDGKQKTSHFRVVMHIDMSPDIKITAKLQKREIGKAETEHHASRPFLH